MKPFLLTIGAGIIFVVGLFVTLAQIPTKPPGPTRNTTQMMGEGFALVREVGNHINRLESDNRNLRAENATLQGLIAEDTAVMAGATKLISRLDRYVSRLSGRVDLLEAFLADNGIPTPADEATFESLKLESN